MTATLDDLFQARSIAVVGASESTGKMGYEVLNALMSGPFVGDLFPINPRRDEILGLRAYPTVAAIGHPVDYAILTVPAEHAAAAVDDCARAGVKVVQITSSGFGEVGDDGKQVETDILATARGAGMIVIGPNCLGTYSAATGICWTDKFAFDPGHVSFVSQSGGLSMDALAVGQAHGVRFSKVLSVGNTIDLDWADYFDYLADDDDTRMVGAYIESVRDGRRMVESLKGLTARKPVFVIKGGKTARGLQSVSSHTGRLAGDYAVWRAALAQGGAVEVDRLEDLIAAWEALQAWGEPPAAGAVLLGNGGGASVLGTDAFEGLGVSLAVLDDGTRERLETVIPYEGVVGAQGNPLDLPARRLIEAEGSHLGDILEILADSRDAGVVALHMNLAMPSFGPRNPRIIELFEGLTARIAKIDGLRLVAVLRTDGSEYVDDLRRRVVPLFRAAGKGPVLRDLDEAARCLALLRRARP